MVEQTNPQMDAKKKSQLISSLREAVAVVQMICFKELRAHVADNYAEKEPKYLAKLTGSIVNEIFGTPNQEIEFQTFRKENWGTIEQELLAIKTTLSSILSPLTDSLRMQVLCDHQEGSDSSKSLTNAQKYGFLLVDRDIPLPSTYMAIIRTIGEKHSLIIAPMQITTKEDQELVN
ncbi:MAG: hypothetical protein OCC45_14810 [Desulfotalea sp.]